MPKKNNPKVPGLIEIIEDSYKVRSELKGECGVEPVIMKFYSLTEAIEFETKFITYLKAKYRSESKAQKFPMRHIFSEKNQSWFLVSKSRYNEVKDYLDLLSSDSS